MPPLGDYNQLLRRHFIVYLQLLQLEVVALPVLIVPFSAACLGLSAEFSQACSR